MITLTKALDSYGLMRKGKNVFDVLSCVCKESTFAQGH